MTDRRTTRLSAGRFKPMPLALAALATLAGCAGAPRGAGDTSKLQRIQHVVVLGSLVDLAEKTVAVRKLQQRIFKRQIAETLQELGVLKRDRDVVAEDLEQIAVQIPQWASDTDKRRQ